MTIENELIEALEPFAEMAAFYENCEQHPNGCPDSALCGELPDLTVGQSRRAAAALSRARSADGQRYRHKVRGTEYTVLGEAEVQAEYAVYEGAKLVIYRGDDGKIWARPTFEFYGGRFERVEAASARISAGDKDRENPVERPGNGEQPDEPMTNNPTPEQMALARKIVEASHIDGPLGRGRASPEDIALAAIIETTELAATYFEKQDPLDGPVYAADLREGAHLKGPSDGSL